LVVLNPNGRRVLAKVWRPRAFAANTPRFFRATWHVRARQRLGTYQVRVAVFRADLGKRFHLNRSAATVRVIARPTTRFGLRPPGATLPSSAQCAARVRPAAEVRPANQRPNRFGDIPNQTRGVAGAWRDADPAKAPFTARVDGNFVGTTDEIIQWAACKWGVDEDYVRAQIVTESYWDQVNSLGDWGNDASGCDPRFPLGTDGRTGLCPQSLGLGQTRYPFMSSAFPHAYNSSAYNLDVTYAIWRACFEGTETWLNNVERGRQYAAGDMLGCMGRWFAGRWYTDAALGYMDVVRGHVRARTWTTPGFRSYDPGG
jgi:autotransporter family porin